MRSFFLLLAIFVSVALIACSNDSAPTSKVPQVVINSLNSQFPNAMDVDWEKEGRYYVAEFMYNLDGSVAKFETDVWFSSDGNWRMTVIDVPYSELPQTVQNSFAASEYANWKVEDVDIVKRNSKETLYIIEVEMLDTDKELYYNESGILTQVRKRGSDDYKDLL